MLLYFIPFKNTIVAQYVLYHINRYNIVYPCKLSTLWYTNYYGIHYCKLACTVLYK